jgi:hypothetical protein
MLRYLITTLRQHWSDMLAGIACALALVVLVYIVGFVRGAAAAEVPHTMIAKVCPPEVDDGDGAECWIIESIPAPTTADCYALIGELRTAFPGYRLFAVCLKSQEL